MTDQQRQAQYVNQAQRYQEAAFYIERDGALPSWFPTHVPRGHPVVWYRQKAQEYAAKAAKAAEMAELRAQLSRAAWTREALI
jgi:hypothetical protein